MSLVRHTIKHSHENGGLLVHPIYWCGRYGNLNSWHFLDAQHLAMSVNGSITPCKECIRSIISELNKELE